MEGVGGTSKPGAVGMRAPSCDMVRESGQEGSGGSPLWQRHEDPEDLGKGGGL